MDGFHLADKVASSRSQTTVLRRESRILDFGHPQPARRRRWVGEFLPRPISPSPQLIPWGLVVGAADGDDPLDVVGAEPRPVVVLGDYDDGCAEVAEVVLDVGVGVWVLDDVDGQSCGLELFGALGQVKH